MVSGHLITNFFQVLTQVICDDMISFSRPETLCLYRSGCPQLGRGRWTSRCQWLSATSAPQGGVRCAQFH